LEIRDRKLEKLPMTIDKGELEWNPSPKKGKEISRL
jgi:hypothetical protein